VSCSHCYIVGSFKSVAQQKYLLISFLHNFFIAFLALLQCLHAQGSYILVDLLLDYGEMSDKDWMFFCGVGDYYSCGMKLIWWGAYLLQ
jgi:hypothetical protein